MEFLKGETDPVGDCGNFAAGIDVHGADQFPHDSKKRTWYNRIECYGNTAPHADELRDKVLAMLVTTEHDGELHKAVFLALESYGGADTFRDGVLALVQLANERHAELTLAKRYLRQTLAAHNPRSRLSCDIRRLIGMNPIAPKVTP